MGQSLIKMDNLWLQLWEVNKGAWRYGILIQKLLNFFGMSFLQKKGDQVDFKKVKWSLSKEDKNFYCTEDIKDHTKMASGNTFLRYSLSSHHFLIQVNLILFHHFRVGSLLTARRGHVTLAVSGIECP